MKRIALVLRGGVSRVSGRLLNPEQVSSSASNYVNFKACARSIKTNIIDTNPDYKFEVFIQSWNPDLKTQLNNIYNPVAASYEVNQSFAPLLNRLSRLSIQNQPKSFSDRLHRKYREGSVDFLKTYAGISQALAIKRSLDLLKSIGQTANYDRVILTRPDLILLKPILLSDYSTDDVYVNRYADHMGDFHWVFEPKWVSLFQGIVDSIESGNFHKQHTWIRDFIQNTCGDSYREDNILAGQDEEVLRQVRYSRISIDRLREFGVKDDEYESYDVIS